MLDVCVEDVGLDREFSGDIMLVLKQSFASPARVSVAGLDGY